MPSNSSRREFLDTVLSVSAAIVAVCALVVTTYQTKIMREQQRASAWPRLDLTNTTGPHLYARVVRNVGLGPALVRNVQVTLDGRSMRDWDDVSAGLFGADYGRVFAADTALRASKSDVRRGIVLLPGASIEQLRLEGGSVPDTVLRAVFSGRLRWSACYCSLYGDCWKTNSWASTDPLPTRACPETADSTREFRD
jgi:hypothetical protein